MSALVGGGDLAQTLQHLFFSSTLWTPIFRVTWCFWFPSLWELLVGTAWIHVGFSPCRSLAERRKWNVIQLRFLYFFSIFLSFVDFSLALFLSLLICSWGFIPFYSLNSYSSGNLGESGDKYIYQSISFNWRLTWFSFFVSKVKQLSVVIGYVGMSGFH